MFRRRTARTACVKDSRSLPGLLGGLVDQAAHGVVGEHQPVDLLADQIGRFAAQGGAGPEDVGLDLVVCGLDFPPPVAQRREFGGRGRGSRAATSHRRALRRPGISCSP